MADQTQGLETLRGPVAFIGSPAEKIYVQPAGLVAGSTAGPAAAPVRVLAGGPLRFSAVILHRRQPQGAAVRLMLPLDRAETLAQARAEAGDHRLADALESLSVPRTPLAGLDFSRPRLMGVLNVTPDSFSDGGAYPTAAAAAAQAGRMVAAGADIIDIGGESTRPGAAAVGVETELSRLLPVIERVKALGAPVSVDTRHARVMAQAVAAGAAIVNDISALQGDGASLATVQRLGVPVVLMHMQGEPATMQTSPVYEDPLLDIFDYLESRIAACERAGIPRSRLIVDPGIGFGKTAEHNRALLRGLALFHGLRVPVLAGLSRKSFLRAVTGVEEPAARLAGSLAGGLWALDQGVQMLRVHDVAQTREALAVWQWLAGMP